MPPKRPETQSAANTSSASKIIAAAKSTPFSACAFTISMPSITVPAGQTAAVSAVSGAITFSATFRSPLTYSPGGRAARGP
ncbi:MAG: hypothetical protein ACD_54C00729G0001 [uncultured bacterium]|nr:MAG: hypothetical protein ACD_54C00729G0001 [uncultured bacterium]